MNYEDFKIIPHCVLFWGNDIEAQYELATEFARKLNCKNSGDENCTCINCNWVKNHAHPAVLTISSTENKPTDDDTKNVISIAQARMIKDMLSTTSEYHRVFIFTNPDGLNKTNFSIDAANALLKTFEEPPENTTFFFLTKDISDMLETIVSRSQCFFIPSKKEESRDFELVKDIMQIQNPLDFSDAIVNLSKEHAPEDIFTQMQNYLLVANGSIDYIRRIEKAKKEIKLGMNIQTVAETLAFEIA